MSFGTRRNGEIDEIEDVFEREVNATGAWEQLQVVELEKILMRGVGQSGENITQLSKPTYNLEKRELAMPNRRRR